MQGRVLGLQSSPQNQGCTTIASFSFSEVCEKARCTQAHYILSWGVSCVAANDVCCEVKICVQDFAGNHTNTCMPGNCVSSRHHFYHSWSPMIKHRRRLRKHRHRSTNSCVRVLTCASRLPRAIHSMRRMKGRFPDMGIWKKCTKKKCGFITILAPRKHVTVRCSR